MQASLVVCGGRCNLFSLSFLDLAGRAQGSYLTAPAVGSSRGWRMGCVGLARTGDRLLALSKAIVAAPSGPRETVAITRLGGEG